MKTNCISLRSIAIACLAILPAPLAIADEVECGKDCEPVPLVKLVPDPENLKGMYEILTGNSSKAEIFSNGSAVALVKVGYKEAQNDEFRFSFNDDGRPARQFFRISQAATRELLDAMKEPRNYAVEEVHIDCLPDPEMRRLKSEEYEKTWRQDVALEISPGHGFVRIYFDKDFTRCYFASDSKGENQSKDWKLNEQITNILRRIVKEAEGKWQELPLKPKPADASGAGK